MNLPNDIQAQANTLLLKLKENPKSPGLNIEKLNFGDSSIRSARVNRDIRVILSIIEDGRSYFFHHIDHHDDAYDWVERKKINIDKITGEIEIVDVLNKTVSEETNDKKLFNALSDSKLSQLGISNEYFNLIRNIENMDDLEDKKNFIPESVYEILFFYASGVDFYELVASYATSDESPTENINNEQKYFVIDDDESLEEFKLMLQSPIDKWRVFLHPSQEKIVKANYTGPAKVTGEAGTGKTVVAVHRAKRLAESIDNDSRILVTTFTTNLAEDIKGYLKDICNDKEYNKIDVINIDKVVSQFIKENSCREKIIYGEELISIWKDIINNVDKANELPVEFYMDEWERVIVEQNIHSLEQYKAANRTGRGYALNRKTKEIVWSVMVEFKKALNDADMMDINLAVAKAIDIALNLEVLPYKYIIIDEIQDFTTSMLTFIRKLAGDEHENDIFMVGDERQSIYGRKLVLKNTGINVVGRSSILRVNYRTTEEIRRWADKILNNNLLTTIDGERFKTEPAFSLIHGKKPNVTIYNSKEEEVLGIIDQIKDWLNRGYESNSICITAKMNKQIDQMKQVLNDHGIRTVLLKNSAEDMFLDGIRLGTMHRIKGKEFDCVAIIGLEDGVIPSRIIDSIEDEVKARELEQIERSLLYVAATRAKLELNITCSRIPSRFL